MYFDIILSKVKSPCALSSEFIKDDGLLPDDVPTRLT